jgi:hypothetical protein
LQQHSIEGILAFGVMVLAVVVVVVSVSGLA